MLRFKIHKQKKKAEKDTHIIKQKKIGRSWRITWSLTWWTRWCWNGWWCGCWCGWDADAAWRWRWWNETAVERRDAEDVAGVGADVKPLLVATSDRFSSRLSTVTPLRCTTWKPGAIPPQWRSLQVAKSVQDAR